MKVFVCTGCMLGRAGFLETVAAAFREAAPDACIAPVACMSGCAREQTLAFRSPNKTAYLFGDLTEADLPELIRFAQLYAASPDGRFPDARELGALRGKALARIPG